MLVKRITSVSIFSSFVAFNGEINNSVELQKVELQQRDIARSNFNN